MPRFSHQAMMVAFASFVGRPSRETSPFLLFFATPSPVKNFSAFAPPAGATTYTNGRPNFAANSPSRSSWAGTAMMAPWP